MHVRNEYSAETHGIRVTVRPWYLGDQSNPDDREYIFAYLVRIENVGTETAQLRSRHWYIRDSIGSTYEVVGDGVVGQQPTLAPGDVHEYHSFCVLKSPTGAMHGTYSFCRDDGSTFDAMIPHFNLIAPTTTVLSA